MFWISHSEILYKVCSVCFILKFSFILLAFQLNYMQYTHTIVLTWATTSTHDGPSQACREYLMLPRLAALYIYIEDGNLIWFLKLIWNYCCISSQMVESRKGRKEKKQGKKGATVKASSTCVSDGGPPDMGALCI